MMKKAFTCFMGSMVLGAMAVPAAQARELPAYLQCVPYARDVSGIQIYGDAHTWWHQASGKFQRGNQPRVGAVMAFQPHRNMRLGHVAAVSRIIDSRTIMLNHANWSPINGRRGQIERDVKAIDVSPANDWSRVRVWYHPIQALGKTAWPVHGFIYGNRSRAPQQAPRKAPPVRIAQSSAPSKVFLSAFADLGQAKPARPVHSAIKAPAQSSRPIVRVSHSVPKASATAGTASFDRVAAAVARYDR